MFGPFASTRDAGANPAGVAVDLQSPQILLSYSNSREFDLQRIDEALRRNPFRPRKNRKVKQEFRPLKEADDRSAVLRLTFARPIPQANVPRENIPIFAHLDFKGWFLAGDVVKRFRE